MVTNILSIAMFPKLVMTHQWVTTWLLVGETHKLIDDKENVSIPMERKTDLHEGIEGTHE